MKYTAEELRNALLDRADDDPFDYAETTLILRYLASNIEGLMADKDRLEWALPILTGDDSRETSAKAIHLGGALMLNKSGREAIDAAIDASRG